MSTHSSTREGSNREGDNRYSALISNANAVRAVAAAVETTLGPKGLNCMLVDAAGDVTVTNDGSTILSRIDASHPAARILIQAARAQEKDVGDGTTTTAVLASALISEGVAQAARGVPIAMLIEGIREGVRIASDFVQAHSQSVADLNSDMLAQVVTVAARGEKDIAEVALRAAEICGMDLLTDPDFDLRQCIVTAEGAPTEAFSGVLVEKDRMNRLMPRRLEDVSCLIVDDALEPESLDAGALSTDRGFSTYLNNVETFKSALDRIISSGVRLVVVQKGVHDVAEEKLTQAGCLVLRRVGTRDLARLAEHTGARPLKRASLLTSKDIVENLGHAGSVEIDGRHGFAMIKDGKGAPAATVLVGARTREVAEERQRMAEDACGALQTAIRTGIVPGGGSIELAASVEVNRMRQSARGMTGYGMDCVSEALKKPLAQIVANAGYNSLEKLEQALDAQQNGGSPAVAIDCDTGSPADMSQTGVFDPAGVKIRALSTAGEVAEAILRINSIVRMKGAGKDSGEGEPE